MPKLNNNIVFSRVGQVTERVPHNIQARNRSYFRKLDTSRKRV